MRTRLQVRRGTFVAAVVAATALVLGACAGSSDPAVLSLETAVTTRGTAQAKQFPFRSPPAAFTALTRAGVDVVTMASNHALDDGPAGVPDTLDAVRAAGMPVVGPGLDAGAAYAPWVTTVKGQRIAVLGATAVVDDSLVESWSAGPQQPGVATAVDGDNAALLAAVRAVRPHAGTVVVELRYGKDLTTCPTAIQSRLATDLVGAGADIVAGQHVHVLLGGGHRCPHAHGHRPHDLGHAVAALPDPLACCNLQVHDKCAVRRHRARPA